MPAILLLLYRLGKSVWNGLKEPQFRGLFTLTVGYGDLSPQTAVGKLFTMFYILLGLSIISSFIVLLAEHQQASRPNLRKKLTRTRVKTDQLSSSPTHEQTN